MFYFCKNRCMMKSVFIFKWKAFVFIFFILPLISTWCGFIWTRERRSWMICFKAQLELSTSSWKRIKGKLFWSSDKSNFDQERDPCHEMKTPCPPVWWPWINCRDICRLKQEINANVTLRRRKKKKKTQDGKQICGNHSLLMNINKRA